MIQLHVVTCNFEVSASETLYLILLFMEVFSILSGIQWILLLAEGITNPLVPLDFGLTSTLLVYSLLCYVPQFDMTSGAGG